MARGAGPGQPGLDTVPGIIDRPTGKGKGRIGGACPGQWAPAPLVSGGNPG